MIIAIFQVLIQDGIVFFWSLTDMLNMYRLLLKVLLRQKLRIQLEQ